MLTRDYILPNAPVADSRWWKCTPPDTVSWANPTPNPKGWFLSKERLNQPINSDHSFIHSFNQSITQSINQSINQISQLLSCVLYRHSGVTPSSHVSYALSGLTICSPFKLWASALSVELTLQIKLGINTRKHSEKVQLFSFLVWCSLPISKCASGTNRSVLFPRYLHLFCYFPAYPQSSCQVFGLKMYVWSLPSWEVTYPL